MFHQFQPYNFLTQILENVGINNVQKSLIKLHKGRIFFFYDRHDKKIQDKTECIQRSFLIHRSQGSLAICFWHLYKINPERPHVRLFLNLVFK